MSTPAPDDRAAIEQAIQTYFDGLYEGDADKLASVAAGPVSARAQSSYGTLL